MSRVHTHVALLTAILGTATVAAQSVRLPSEPTGLFGRGVTGAYDGWFTEGNSERMFLVGYYNRNHDQVLNIPVGPNNRIEPGEPDQGQPTTFLPGRHIGMFIVRVPKTFTERDTLTWTLVANGETTRIPLRLKTDYYISPFGGEQVGNEPPRVRFVDHEPLIQGPSVTLASAFHITARTGVPQPLSLTAQDDARYTSGTSAIPRNPPPPVAVHWTTFRGPWAVAFERDRPALQVSRGGKIGELFEGTATTTATFARPGEYVLHALVTDFSGEGGGGEVCCWTNILVRVTVTD